MNTEDITKIAIVTKFAADSHRNQRRKDAEKTPYINHPINVYNILVGAGIFTTDVLCGALLHDVIEDCGVTREQIEKLFGKDVADMVQDCSDDKSLPKEVRKQKQIEHMRDLHERAKKGDKLALGAAFIKSADKIDNMSGLIDNPPAAWSKEIIDGYFLWGSLVSSQFHGFNEVIEKQLEEIYSHIKFREMSPEQIEQGLNVYYALVKGTD